MPGVLRPAARPGPLPGPCFLGPLPKGSVVPALCGRGDAAFLARAILRRIVLNSFGRAFVRALRFAGCDRSSFRSNIGRRSGGARDFLMTCRERKKPAPCEESRLEPSHRTCAGAGGRSPPSSDRASPVTVVVMTVMPAVRPPVVVVVVRAVVITPRIRVVVVVVVVVVVAPTMMMVPVMMVPPVAPVRLLHQVLPVGNAALHRGERRRRGRRRRRRQQERPGDDGCA